MLAQVQVVQPIMAELAERAVWALLAPFGWTNEQLHDDTLLSFMGCDEAVQTSTEERCFGVVVGEVKPENVSAGQ